MYQTRSIHEQYHFPDEEDLPRSQAAAHLLPMHAQKFRSGTHLWFVNPTTDKNGTPVHGKWWVVAGSNPDYMTVKSPDRSKTAVLHWRHIHDTLTVKHPHRLGTVRTDTISQVTKPHYDEPPPATKTRRAGTRGYESIEDILELALDLDDPVAL